MACGGPGPGRAGMVPRGVVWRRLMRVVNRYSGSDIAVIVRDALMQPVRKVLGATHFHPVSLPSFIFPCSRLTPRPRPAQVQVPSKDDPSQTVTKLTPCSPGAPGAIEKTWTDIGSDELLEPALTVADFERAISVNRKTVTEADVAKHIAFTNEAGEFSGPGGGQ